MGRWKAVLLAGVAAFALGALPLSAQAPRAPVPGAETPRLTPAQLDALLEPYAGAPQEAVGLVLDAARYPADLMAADAWAKRPAESRGQIDADWAPPVKVLAERAPRTLTYLTENIAQTSALGSAYATQPNDAWLAYGRVTTAAQETAEAEAQARSQEPPQAQQAAPAQAPAQAQPQAAEAAPPAPPAAAPAAAPATTTTVVESGGSSTVGTAIVSGAIGIGAGLLLGELFEDDDEDWGYGYGGGYYAPPPYYPAGSVDRDAMAGRQDQRQEARGERQEQRQENRGDRQENRGDRVEPRSAGADRRASATQGQRAPMAELGGAQRPATQQARPATQQARPATQQQRPVASQRAAQAPARRAPQASFGPAAGANNRTAVNRSRPAASPQRAAPQRSTAPQRSAPQRSAPAARGGGGGGRR